MNGELRNAFAQQIFERDKEEFALGDTLDIKTSIILVVLTFLASQASNLLPTMNANFSSTVVVLFYAAIAFLLLGGMAAVGELWPRNYNREATPEKYEKWLDDLRDYYKGEPDPESRALAEATLRRAEITKERIQSNLAINRQKSWLMTTAFIATVIAFTLNLAVMATRLF